MTASPDETHPSDSSSDAPPSDVSSEEPADSSEGGNFWKWLGGIGVWFVLASVITGIVAEAQSNATEGPEFDKAFDQLAGWVFFGVPAGIAVVGGLAWGAFWGVSTLLTRRRERVKRRELILRERVNGLQKMVREAQEVSRDLELYLEERLAALKALDEQVENQERLASLTPEQVKAVDRALDRQFSRSRRSGQIKQFIGVLLSIPLAFVVNWLSDPLREVLGHWWHF